MSAYNNAPRGGDPQGDAPAQKNRARLNAYPSIFASISKERLESQLLTRRIGAIRARQALGAAGLQAAAGSIIERHPGCPPRASKLVDRITVAMDLARVEGRP
jgi:hypothetical protein